MIFDIASVRGLLARLDDIGMRAGRISGAVDKAAGAALPSKFEDLLSDVRLAADQIGSLPGSAAHRAPLMDAIAGAYEIDDVERMRQVARTLREVVPELRAGIIDQFLAPVVSDEVPWLRARLADGPSTLSPSDWSRVRSLLTPESAARLGLERSIAGLPDVDAALEALVTGTPPGNVTQRYVARWRIGLDGAVADPERARALLRSVLERDPALMTRTDWHLLRALLDVHGADGLRVSRAIRGVSDLDQMLKVLVELPAPGPNARTMLATWRMQLDGVFDDTERARAVLGERLARGDAMTADDWAHVRGLVMAGDQLDLGLRTSIPGLHPVEETLAEMVRNPQQGTNARTYASVWRAQADGLVDDPERGRDALRALLRPGLDDMGSADWHAIRGLLLADETNKLGVRRVLLGSPDLSELLANLVTGARPGEHTRAFATRWADELGITLETRRTKVLAALEGGDIDPALRIQHLDAVPDVLAAADPGRRAVLEMRLLARDTPDSITTAKDFVDRARRIEPVLEPGSAEGNRWLAAKRLLDLNADRMNGIHSDRHVRGYANHPDYAELGRARAHMEFVARVQSGVPAPPETSTATGIHVW